jgi:hypothetical protein
MIFIRGNIEVIESDELPLVARKESKDHETSHNITT